MNEELKHLFTPGPMVSFRSSRKITSYLVRAKLYPVERSARSFNCKRPRCQICAQFYQYDYRRNLTKLIIDLTAWRNA